MPHRLSSLVSSLALATSLLLGAACSSTTRAGADAGTRPDVTRSQPAPIDRAALRAALADRRQQSLDRFLAYRNGRVYPRNSYVPGLQHVWMDDEGHLCAAATLISDDWGRDAAARIAAENNYLMLADVHDGPIADWMLTSGMTHHEIVAIQEPMMYEGPTEPPADDPKIVAELDRLYGIYTSVERQVHQLWDESLDEATDALIAHPDLARSFLRGEIAGAGKYDEPIRAADEAPRFARPPAA